MAFLARLFVLVLVAVSTEAAHTPPPPYEQVHHMPTIIEFVNKYINYGASSAGGAPDCEAWTALFDTNATTRAPIDREADREILPAQRTTNRHHRR